uniref:Uncharacterized protein n=1 Tax=Podoviridae sp. ct3lO13 TaxID=2826538 RepID=A0A8S5QSA4_9CAUD|nr:MAG TPA: hypothetical protein [Podoviridae sp. ct3lO13]
MKDVPYFRFWCYKVLPLVYDNSLSYYEVLCKVVRYINDLIEQDKIFGNELANLLKDLEKVKEWINNFDTSFVEELIKIYIATMILVEISDSGYIIYNIPESWKDITFNTTGLDIKLKIQPEYGHLVLSY